MGFKKEFQEDLTLDHWVMPNFVLTRLIVSKMQFLKRASVFVNPARKKLQIEKSSLQVQFPRVQSTISGEHEAGHVWRRIALLRLKWSMIRVLALTQWTKKKTPRSESLWERTHAKNLGHYRGYGSGFINVDKKEKCCLPTSHSNRKASRAWITLKILKTL